MDTDAMDLMGQPQDISQNVQNITPQVTNAPINAVTPQQLLALKQRFQKRK